MDKEKPEVIYQFNEYEGDRAERLDHMQKAKNVVHQFIREHPNRMLILRTVRDGKVVSQTSFNPYDLICACYSCSWTTERELTHPMKRRGYLDWTEEFNPFGQELVDDIKLANRPKDETPS